MPGQMLQLEEEEAQHAFRVLRLSIGATIHVSDGKGSIAQACITSITKREVQAQIQSIDTQKAADYKIILCVAPTKNAARFEWFLEKASEMGIDEVYPMLCEHSERKVLNIERTNKVITAAVKQSLKAFHPVLHPMTSFKELITKDFNANKYLSHLLKDQAQKSLKEVVKANENILVFIGPEGDFSAKEIELAKKQGVELVHLGPSRLRTETAALAACFTINLINQ